MALSDRELERYARQLVLPDWSVAAQERLRDARAIVIGAGALGCPAAAYLVAAGVGRVGLVDDDVVELSNLHRQTLHTTDALGAGKAEAAAAHLGRLNDEVVVEPYPVRIEADNAAAIVAGCDVVLDCSDSFASRYLVNDACCAAGVGLIEAGVAGLEGLVMTIEPGETACYRCAFPTEPARSPSCAETGILGPVAGVVGSLQALEAIKLLTGVGRPLRNSILHLDAVDMTHTVIATTRRPACAACGGDAATAQLR